MLIRAKNANCTYKNPEISICKLTKLVGFDIIYLLLFYRNYFVRMSLFELQNKKRVNIRFTIFTHDNMVTQDTILIDRRYHSMVTAFYFTTFIIALIMFGVNIFRSKKADTRFVLVGLLVTLNCFGRYMLSISNTVELAILSTKIMYIGACFITPTILICVTSLCGIKIHKFIPPFLVSFASVIYGFVLMIGHNKFYYKHVELAYKDGYYYLIKEYGPAHTLYYIFLILCMILLLYYLIIAIRNRKQMSIKSMLMISIFAIAMISCYIIQRLVNTSIEWLSLGYLLVDFVLIGTFDRYNMYDITINIAQYVERMQEYGYVVFDNKNRYVNSNELAKKIFPQINNWVPDTAVAPDDSPFYHKILSDIEQWKIEKSKKELQIGDVFIELTIRELSYSKHKKQAGFIIEMTDRTLEKKYLQTIESYNTNLESEVNEKTANIMYIKDKMVLGMATMIEGRDYSTGGHIKRTSDVVRIFSEYLMNNENEYAFSREFLESVIKAAPMHDLGKITVPDRILQKQGKFTDEEYDEMKKHSEQGAIIVENILDNVEDASFVSVAKNVAHYHHEKWNGKGYPCGLEREEIPVEARIMALADVFDALVSKRCYKEAFSYDKAFEIIKGDLGTHFDPQLGKLFIECRSRLEDLYEQYVDE